MKTLLIIATILLSHFAHAEYSYYEDNNAVYFAKLSGSSNIFYIPKLKLYFEKSSVPDSPNRLNYDAALKFSTDILTQEQLYALRPSWEGYSLTPYRLNLSTKCDFKGVIPGVYNDVIEISNVNGRDIGAGDGVDPCSFLFGVVARYKDIVLPKLTALFENNNLIELEANFSLTTSQRAELALTPLHTYLTENVTQTTLTAAQTNFYVGYGSALTYEINNIVSTFNNSVMSEFMNFANSSLFKQVDNNSDLFEISANKDAIFYYNETAPMPRTFSLF